MMPSSAYLLHLVQVEPLQWSLALTLSNGQGPWDPSCCIELRRPLIPKIISAFPKKADQEWPPLAHQGFLNVQETEQLGIKGQDIPAELKQLPQQLPHLLQPLVDLLQSQLISDAIAYHADFLQHIHKTAAGPAQHSDGTAGAEPTDSGSATPAHGYTFQAVHQMRNMESAAPSQPTSSTKEADLVGSADAGIPHQSSHPRSCAESINTGISLEGQPADAGAVMHQAPGDSRDEGTSGLRAADDAEVAEIDWSAALEADDAAVGSAEGAEAEGLQADIDWDIDLAGVEVLEDEPADPAEPGASGEALVRSIPHPAASTMPSWYHANCLNHASCLQDTYCLHHIDMLPCQLPQSCRVPPPCQLPHHMHAASPKKKNLFDVLRQARDCFQDSRQA